MKELVLTFSSRVPYDFEVNLYPGSVNIIVNGLDYYRSDR